MNNILVCVTQQKQCENLINEAIKLKSSEDDNLSIIHIVKEGWSEFSNLNEPDALEYLFDVAKGINAMLQVIKAKDISTELQSFICDNDINIVVMGKSREEHNENNIIKVLTKKFETKNIKFIIV